MMYVINGRLLCVVAYRRHGVRRTRLSGSSDHHLRAKRRRTNALRTGSVSLARHFMTHSRRGDTDASAFAESQATTWRRIYAQLAPIIGGRAVHVLFERALQQIVGSFPWLTIHSAPHADVEALLNNLKVQVAMQSEIAAIEACFALRLAFNELLGTLIGNALTERLVSGAWEYLPSSSRSEPQHE